MIDFDDVVAALRFYERNDYLLHDDADELITRLRQAEKDAARYRWLRSTADVDGTADLMISIIASDEWDSLIDEAMQCK